MELFGLLSRIIIAP